MIRKIFPILILCVALSCETLGSLIGGGDLNQQGAEAFEKMKQTVPIDHDARTNAYVKCIANAILEYAAPLDPSGLKRSDWEIVVFKDESPNAFALPGGKIGVHTGIFSVALNQDQLATVMGHEVAHVTKEHGKSRVGGAMITGGAIAIGQQIGISETMTQGISVLAQYGLLLPFGRSQESEADVVGLDYMASVGFNPSESVRLWQNMSAMSGKRPPEYMSTHPDPDNRIKKLQQNIPAALTKMTAARSTGRRPSCSR